MLRDVSHHFDAWLREPGRLPLVVRGARQVGKTWLVRDLAARHGLDLVECNLERDAAAARCFPPGASPRRMLDDLALVVGRDVVPGRSLLFLDEAQARPDVLAALRWFAEDTPELAVVAAGSLLEFVLAEHEFSMPVGRVTYLHVAPMTFCEFATAHGNARLVERLAAWRADDGPLSDVVHDRATELWTQFVMTGGMPAVVAADVAAGATDARGAGGRGTPGSSAGRTVRRIQTDLIATYRDDFAKYRRRADPHVLDAVLRSVALQTGQRFVYAHAAEGVSHTAASAALDLLVRARLCHVVRHSAANGVPLAAESNDRLRKVLMLDVGLVHALLETPPGSAASVWDRLPPTVRGRLSEQAVGQELLSLREPWSEPALHHWQRGGGRAGEVDFLLAIDGRVVPVEVKSGRAGAMKSLHQFMHDKHLQLAVRCDANPPSSFDVDLSTTTGDRVQFRLLSVPPYLLWRIPDLVAAA